MKNKYLANAEYNYEKVNRASLACGPMVKWAIAQVVFSSPEHKERHAYNVEDITGVNTFI